MQGRERERMRLESFSRSARHCMVVELTSCKSRVNPDGMG